MSEITVNAVAKSEAIFQSTQCPPSTLMSQNFRRGVQMKILIKIYGR